MRVAIARVGCVSTDAPTAPETARARTPETRARGAESSAR